MLKEERLPIAFARHTRHGSATRLAVRGMGLDVLRAHQGQESGVLTADLMPEGHSADAFRVSALEALNIALGNGLSKVSDRVFRIGHLGDFNELMLIGTLAGSRSHLNKPVFLMRKGRAVFDG